MTLDAVARTAGVSPATASRALNGTARVRDDLRGRVLTAADRLGYIPNAHAQALASASSNTVGVICHDVGDPYFAAIASGVTAAAAERGLLVMPAGTFREIAYVSMLRAQRARAVLLIGSGFQDPSWERQLDAELGPYTRAGGRVAVVSRHRSLRVDTVLPENRAGAGAPARALLGLGHRDFAVLTGPERLTTVADRLGGFRAAPAEAGVALPRERVVEGGVHAGRRVRGRGGAAAPGPPADVRLRGDGRDGGRRARRAAGAGRAGAGRRVARGLRRHPSRTGADPAVDDGGAAARADGRDVLELALREPRGRRSRVRRVPGEVVLRRSTGRYS